MLRPNMERRVDERMLAVKDNVAGIAITRNPGVICLWTVKAWRTFDDGKGGTLFNIGEPRHVSWWREGRPATFAEVMESIDSGTPLLREMCDTPEAHYELGRRVGKAIDIARDTATR